MLDSMRKRWANLARQLPYIPTALKMVWAAAPGYTSVWLVLLVAQGLLPVATVYLTRTAVNSLAAVVADINQETLWQATWGVSLLVGTTLASQLLSSFNQWIQSAQSEQVTDYIKERVHDKAISLDMSYFETPLFYDMLHRAKAQASSMPLTLVKSLGGIIQNSLTLVAMMGILLPYGTWVPFALIAGTIPAVIVVTRLNRQINQWRNERAPLQREISYYEHMATNLATAAELRLFALGPLFIGRFRTGQKQLRQENLTFLRRQIGTQLLAKLISMLTIGTTLAILAWKTITTGGTLGDLALFYQAINQGQRLSSTLLNSFGSIYSNLLFLENLFLFLELEPHIPEPAEGSNTPVPFQDKIEIQQISFIYPGSERKALDQFSLTIPAGKIVAIVGENGAGKSTLIKLLTRLYDPTEGRITLDGRDLRDLPLANLRRLYTILFQTSVQYHQTVYENIAMGDWNSQPSRDAVQTAAIAAGADTPISKLPQGLDSMLGKRFAGSELSLGEWQRVALARAFLRQSNVIILDEPTSSMDSWAEAAWLARFRDLAAGKTAVIITHRFTTAMQADIIHVMVGGQVTESGTHEELLVQNGHYATSWRAQSQNQAS